MVYIIYFSPTGGVKKVARAISDIWKPETKEIDLANREDDYSNYYFTADDICIAAVPSYGGRVPDAAVKRLSAMHADNSKTMAVVVYGNRDYDDTLLELKTVLTEAGFQVGALITSIAQHSVIHQIAAGRPDVSDIEELKKYGAKIKETWESGKVSRELTPKGNYPYREYKGIPLKPKAGKNCTSCGLCASNCPVGAIPKENPAQTDNNLCISCMRCIQICPVQARKLNSLLLKAAGSKLEKSCKERKGNTCMM